MVAAEVSNGGSDVEWGDSGDEVDGAYGFSDDAVRRGWNMESGVRDGRPPEGSKEAMAGLLYFVVCVCGVNRPAER